MYQSTHYGKCIPSPIVTFLKPAIFLGACNVTSSKRLIQYRTLLLKTQRLKWHCHTKYVAGALYRIYTTRVLNAAMLDYHSAVRGTQQWNSDQSKNDSRNRCAFVSLRNYNYRIVRSINQRKLPWRRMSSAWTLLRGWRVRRCSLSSIHLHQRRGIPRRRTPDFRRGSWRKRPTTSVSMNPDSRRTYTSWRHLVITWFGVGKMAPLMTRCRRWYVPDGLKLHNVLTLTTATTSTTTTTRPTTTFCSKLKEVQYSKLDHTLAQLLVAHKVGLVVLIRNLNAAY